ncbi:HAD domain-containing protein [Bernardetia sp.]|uniref:HAD domain-containing protein n=1 Tax=Bernardetia sp. TaxID=1937974 RepID=UPI0025C3EFA1|nr:HAD domain-containing protein [Bernardetia sp.]
MSNIIFLDLDGVLITTPSWKADQIDVDGYSMFNKKCVENFNLLTENLECEIWLSSTRRMTKNLEEFRKIFSNRNIEKEIAGFLPIPKSYNTPRIDEIESFLRKEKVGNFLILDDDSSLHKLGEENKKYWVRTHLTIGFDSEKLAEAKNIITNLWKL